MCNGEGALLHGQLVKFGELLKEAPGRGGGRRGGRGGQNKQETPVRTDLDDATELRILQNVSLWRMRGGKGRGVGGEMEHETCVTYSEGRKERK